MRVPRVFHSDARLDAELELGPVAFGHVVRVLRKNVGDTVIVLDGVGGAYRAEILSIAAENETFRARVIAEDAQSAPPVLPLGVAVGVPRGDVLEVAIRMASETGLAWIQPLVTKRTVARPRGRNKIDRWQRIALESAEQCRRHRPIEVFEPVVWSAFLDRQDDHTHGWVAVPGADPLTGCGLRESLRESSDCVVLIGPEGGLTSDEIDQAMEHGYRAVGFPTPVLRTPTAVVYVAAVASLIDL